MDTSISWREIVSFARSIIISVIIRWGASFLPIWRGVRSIIVIFTRVRVLQLSSHFSLQMQSGVFGCLNPPNAPGSHWVRKNGPPNSRISLNYSIGVGVRLFGKAKPNDLKNIGSRPIARDKRRLVVSLCNSDSCFGNCMCIFSIDRGMRCELCLFYFWAS